MHWICCTSAFPHLYPNESARADRVNSQEAECTGGAAPPHSYTHTQMRAPALTVQTHKRPSVLEVMHLTPLIFPLPCHNRSARAARRAPNSPRTKDKISQRRYSLLLPSPIDLESI